MKRILAISIFSILPFFSALADVKFGQNGKIMIGENGFLNFSPILPSLSWLNATMTSDITPLPNIVTSDPDVYDKWLLFDHDFTTYCQFPVIIGSFGSAIFDFGSGNNPKVTLLKFKNIMDFGIASFHFSGTNEKGDWWSLLSGANATNTEILQEFPVTINSNFYRYYRLSWFHSFNPNLIKIYEIALWGFPTLPPSPPSGEIWLNATMTSNTDPSPNSIQGDYPTLDRWKLFDHDLVTWCGFPVTSDILTYNFGSGNSHKSTLLKIKNVQDYGINAFTFKGSNDNINYDLLYSGNAANNKSLQEFSFANSINYQYYRFSWTSAYNAEMRAYEIEIWGI